MKRALGLILMLLVICLVLLGGGQEENFLKSTGLDYEKATMKSSIENGLNIHYYCYYDETDGHKYITAPEFKLYTEYLDVNKTVIMIIDPWSDMQFPEVNESIEQHVDSYLLPLVELAVDKGISVYIFTNNPETIDYNTKKTIDYNTKINAKLSQLVDGENVVELYYDSVGGTEGFGELLKNDGVENIIFTGYATQMCMLYRNVGVIPMWYNTDFDLFVIPEATMPVLADNKELDMAMRNNICTMLSQQRIADIIQYEDFIEYLESISNNYDE